MTTWFIGDQVHLVPVLSTAPSIAYRQPQCRIVTLTGSRVEVELYDGQRLWTSLRNIRTRPLQPLSPTAKPAHRRLTLADNEEETTLW